MSYARQTAMGGVRDGSAAGTSAGDELPKPGELIADKYEVEKILGSGGMGVVIRARHRQLGRLVAIKLLHPDLVSDERCVARFVREARAAVALQGEHTVQVSDVGILDTGVPYMIMEYLQGQDLESLLEAQGRLPIAVAVDYVLQASVAVAEAHARHLVHRDLKPSNLFLSRAIDGEPLVKVLDFGIAKALDRSSADRPNLTTTGLALGTPLFMSPEQVRDASTADRRCDIWALGAVLHQLLTGKPPFHADTLPALCAKIAADPPTPLRSLRPEAPAELEQIVTRCLAKDADDRYPDVAELARALAAVAPARSLALVESIERIVQGSSSLPSLPDGWRPHDETAETMASTPGHPPSAAQRPERTASTGDAVTSPHTDVTPSGPHLGETAGAWQAEAMVPRRRTAVAAAAIGLAVGLAAVIVWAPWADPSRDQPPATDPAGRSLETATVDGQTDEPDDPDRAGAGTASAPMAMAPTATASASASASTPPPSSTAASPAGTPHHPAAQRPRAVQPPPRTKPTYDLLDERK